MSYHRHAYNWGTGNPPYQWCEICQCYPEHFIAKDDAPWPKMTDMDARSCSGFSSSQSLPSDFTTTGLSTDAQKNSSDR